MTAPFREPAYFDKVFLDFGALTWSNGFDWSPEALHADIGGGWCVEVRDGGGLTTQTESPG